MKRTVAAVVVAAVVGVTPAFAGKRFGPHDPQCQAGPDQLHCPGNH